MRFGLTLPIFDQMADPTVLSDLAVEAEDVGWDGVFVWDHVYYRPPATAATDPWIAVAAMASSTRRIRLGPLVTPLARRRPHIVARQLVALDHLSRGRVVLGVGLGLDASGGEFSRFGEETNTRRRADMLDEALTLLTDLLSGDPISHTGPFFKASGVRFLPRPLAGNVPIWVAARWPNRGPLRRAAKHDGVFLIDCAPPSLREAVRYIESLRSQELAEFEVVVHYQPGSDPRPWQEAGATWLLVTFDPFIADRRTVSNAIGVGPPT